MSKFNTDFSLISNSSLQYFPSTKSTLKNSYANHLQHNKYKEATLKIINKTSSDVSTIYKMKCGYNLLRYKNFPFNSTLSHQQYPIRRNNNNIDIDFCNHLIKQEQHSTRNSSTLLPVNVLLNTGLLQNANTGIFSTHKIMPVPGIVSPSLSVFHDDLRYRNIDSFKRADLSKMLYSRLEKNYEQLKKLEKERKKCEASLTARFPGKKITSVNNISIPRLQGSTSRVDKLILDHFRENARVATLIIQMERLRGAEMNQRIHKALSLWYDAIKYVRQCRKQEIVNSNKGQKENLHIISIDNGNAFLDKHELADSIYKLEKASRFARTAMYNAMQTTLLYDSEVETKIVENNQDILMKHNLNNLSLLMN